MHIPFVDLAAQDAPLIEELQKAMCALMQRRDWILGVEVAEFEREFASYCDARHAIGTDSGLSAIELALRAYDIGRGHEVITAANTFIATALAISHTGATPILVDVCPDTYCIDPNLVERAVTKRTRAIIPVHLYGHPAEMDGINAIAEAHRLVVIEDACQAHGASYRGGTIGSLGHAAAFSFYPSKNLGAYGDGGIVVTSDEQVAAAVRLLRNYGQETKNHHLVRGFNRRLDSLQAAILRVKLRQLDEWNRRRREVASLYGELLKGTGLAVPSVRPDCEHVWHLYVVRTRHRDELRTFLSERGIEAGIHYPAPIHLQPAYRELGYRIGSFPISEAYAEQILSLPMHGSLSPDAVAHVSMAIRHYSFADSGDATDSATGRTTAPSPTPVRGP